MENIRRDEYMFTQTQKKNLQPQILLSCREVARANFEIQRPLRRTAMGGSIFLRQ